MMDRRVLLQILAYIGVSIAWGTTYGGIKVAVESFPPFMLAAVRFLIAGALMILVFRAVGISLPRASDYRRLAIVGFFLLSLSNGLLSLAEQYVDSAFAALMVNTAPFVFVALTAISGHRVPRLAWLGLVVGFSGVLILVSPQLLGLLGSEDPPDPTFWFALIALIIGPLCWAVGSFISNRNPPDCHPMMGAAWQTFFGGIGALFLMAVSGEWMREVTPTAASVWAIVYLILVGSFLGYVCYNYCVITLPSQKTASTTYLNMIVAILVGTLLLGEVITSQMILGGGVILLGVVLVNLGKVRVRKEAPSGVIPAEEPVAGVIVEK
ncbi:MAG: EamA family transporter [Candidatus Sumerlaeia bacterium]|nr:EamA family transporter [Candidatus Sumerlaeia bacterium]